MVTEKYL